MKTIVFVRNAANPRMYNQMFALKQTNKYRLIHVCKTFDSYTLSRFNKVFDKIICYQPLDLQKHGLRQNVKSSFPIHFMRYVIAHYIDPRIGHLGERIRLPSLLKQLKVDVFNCLGTCELTAQVIKNTKSPVILDFHNGSISKGIENLSKEEYERDKYCFEHASGIIHRGPKFEMDYYRSHGYKITCPIFHYVDGCNKEFFVKHNVKKLSDEDREYHLVNTGSGLYSHDNIIFTKKITKQKIHMHIYPVPHSIISPIVFKELIKLNKTEKYFHLEKAVPFDKVPQEISKYDFGLNMTGDLHKYRQEYLKIASGYRIFTYFEASLPIILSNRMEFMKKIVEENKAGFSVKDNEIDDIQNMIKKYNYKELRENVFRAREKLSINNYAERLIKFYDEIIQKDR
ncbi:MAG: hypothetical protein L6265_02070 [Thermoplasmatales archaeon]|nr:hypothetical protein [Thermoplasmatales archaeon]